MNRIEVENALQAQGWTLHQDKAGGRYALLGLANRMLSLNFDANPDGSLLLNWSVSDPAFSKACQTIQGEIDFPLPLSHWQKFAPGPAPDFVREIRLGREWAEAENVAVMIDHYVDGPADRPGVGALYHLAGLAVRGQIETLTRYQEKFAAGDRLGMPGYVTDAYLDRALQIAGQD